jgi:type II secretory pathway pseudopilin PulG
LDDRHEEATLLNHRIPRTGEHGFSIVEVMIAALLLLIIAIGILPLFAQSILSNAQGQDNTTAANFARSKLEEFRQLSFDNPLMQVTTGTQVQYNEVYLQKAHTWVAGTVAPAGDFALWSRTTFVRDYTANDMINPLPAGTDVSFIQLKEIEVQVVSNRNTNGTTISWGAGKGIDARVYKSA